MQNAPDFNRAREYSINRLLKELSPKLTYHNLGHTFKEVVPAVDRLARRENVKEVDRMLLLTAAYYHDLGFISQRQGHEAISIELAEEILPKFGYSSDQVEIIRSIIEATCIPQTPIDLLGRIMADADLDYLGQDNFWIRSNDLRNELENFGPMFADMDWYLYQLHFIQAHHYFTESQRLLRDPKKQQHMLALQKRLNQVSPT